MTYYQIKNKLIYRRYRILKTIIWEIKYINMKSFKRIVLSLINIICSYTNSIYGCDDYLYHLNNYYAKMCIAEMTKRIFMEENTRKMLNCSKYIDTDHKSFVNFRKLH